MKAAVYVGDTNRPVPRAGDSRTRPARATSSSRSGRAGSATRTCRSARLRPVPPGMVLGHEGAAASSDGPEVSRVSKGDGHRVLRARVRRVLHCLREQTELWSSSPRSRARCAGPGRTEPVLLHDRLGTFAEVKTVDESSVVRVETDIPDCAARAHRVRRYGPASARRSTPRGEAGSSVAVLAAGGVARAVIQGARIAGAGASSRSTAGAEAQDGKQLGATDIITRRRAIRRAGEGPHLRRGADTLRGDRPPGDHPHHLNLARRGGEVIIVGMARLTRSSRYPRSGIFYEERP